MLVNDLYWQERRHPILRGGAKTRGLGSRMRESMLPGLAALVIILTTSSSVHAAGPFEFKDVVREARLLSKKSFQQPKGIPDVLAKLDYNQWRSIRFKPEDALWRKEGLPFQVQFFHPGSLYNRIVDINVVQAGKVKPIHFSPTLFNYGMNDFGGKVPHELGFAGFSVHYPISVPKQYGRVLVFLGASYFRAVASGEHFGLSARGLAIDTAMKSGEEFPYFRKFWLVRPAGGANSMTIFALLDSQSLTGAYQFRLQPGKVTVIDVTCELFLRREVEKLGIAPLNSMFFYGENTNIRPIDDYRPQIHDSDGLQIATSTGGWIWRPLVNPKRLLVSSINLNNPRGFGLFQRDQSFADYQDIEADYQSRPSVWITPRGGWGEGRVELVEIPTDTEKNNNIVTYWVPATPAKPEKPVTASYEMKWSFPEMAEPPLGRVVSTRTATDTKSGAKMYLVDFKGGELSKLPDNAVLTADIAVEGGKVIEHAIRKNVPEGTWRLVFQVKKEQGPLNQVRPGGSPPIDLRAFLYQGNNVLTETWNYVDPF